MGIPLKGSVDYSDVSVLIPCLNEEKTIAGVVREFRAALPGAQVYVFDNRSTDRTAEVARAAGAHVVFSARPGKGNVVRHMFNLVDAGVYVMVDGDSTYPAASAPAMIELLRSRGADMVVGTRLESYTAGAFRGFHLVGNRIVARLISLFFRIEVSDVLSGYRVLSREFVKTAPLVSRGFEVETEMTLQAAAKNFLLLEAGVPYGTRPEGSYSKLNTFSDGYIVLKSLVLIFKDYRPLVFFSFLAFLFGVASIVAGSAPLLDYFEFHYVYRVPLAILAAALATVSIITFFVGVILETVRKFHGENFELWRKHFQQANRRWEDAFAERAGDTHAKDARD